MCTVFLALNQHKKYPVVLAANRDEFTKRTSDPMHWWKKENLLAGQDHEKKGTWLGLNTSGDWGVITNYRDLSMNMLGEKSRGDIIVDIIANAKLHKNFKKYLVDNANIFGPFNILFSINKKVYCFNSVQKKIDELTPGIYGLSNAYLNAPWFKVTNGKNMFTELVKNKTIDKEEIFEYMKNTDQAPDNELPNTGLDYNAEKLVSSLFIKSDNYRTHCTTVMLVDKEHRTFVEERRTDKTNSKFLF